MGVLPCELPEGVSAEALGLDGTERFDLVASGPLRPHRPATLGIERRDGRRDSVPLVVRIDTPIEAAYFSAGGILPYVLDQLLIRRRGQQVARPGCVMIRIKRTYEPPARGDGRRILVERLWPRGMKKEALAADAWMKDVAPSTELRKWFDHRVERWEEFRRRYRDELNANADAWKPILEAGEGGPVTLLYSAHDTLHNGAIVLRDYLAARQAKRAARRGARARERASGQAARCADRRAGAGMAKLDDDLPDTRAR